jgi:hypothetical protein
MINFMDNEKMSNRPINNYPSKRPGFSMFTCKHRKQQTSFLFVVLRVKQPSKKGVTFSRLIKTVVLFLNSENGTKDGVRKTSVFSGLRPRCGGRVAIIT